jgi:hypothetical protein
VWQNQIAKAQALFLELGRQLAVSPDLTTPHRYNLIRLYKANIEREIEVFNAVNPTGGQDERITRGGGGAGGKAAIQQVLNHLPKASVTRTHLTEMAAKWESLGSAYSGRRDEQLTDAVLSCQLRTLSVAVDAKPDPNELLDALAITVIR